MPGTLFRKSEKSSAGIDGALSRTLAVPTVFRSTFAPRENHAGLLAVVG